MLHGTGMVTVAQHVTRAGIARLMNTAAITDMAMVGTTDMGTAETTGATVMMTAATGVARMRVAITKATTLAMTTAVALGIDEGRGLCSSPLPVAPEQA